MEQAGRPAFDTVDGQPRMRSGVLVRHLLLPGQVEESCRVIRLLYERYGDEVQYSLMNQYTPIIAPGSATARRFPELLGRVSDDEYNLVLDFADNLGLTEYYWQDGPTAEESFIPAFDYEGVDHAAGGAKDQPGADETGSRGAGKPVS